MTFFFAAITYLVSTEYIPFGAKGPQVSAVKFDVGFVSLRSPW
jgi:hypothetical protein